MADGDPNDIASLLYSPDEPTAREKMAAAVAALRGQQGIAGVAELTGDPVLSRFGSGLAQRAQHQQDTLNTVPQQRLKMAAEALANQKAKREETESTSPLRQSMLAQQAKAAGVDVPEGASAGMISSVLPEALKVRGLQKYAPLQPGSSVLDVHTGKVSGGGGGGALLGEAALTQAAERFSASGELPSLGMGAAGAAVRRQIINKAAELHPDANLAANKAGYHADTGSLASLQKSADAIDAFEQTAGKNLDQFLSLAKGPIDTGSPLINKPLRAIDQKLLGSPEMAAFNVARQVAINEIAKVLNNPGMGGVLSDSARHEVEGLIGPDATLKQIYAAANILKTDMANRKAAMAGQLSTVRGRLGVQPASAQAGEAAPAAPAMKRKVYDPATGTIKEQ